MEIIMLGSVQSFASEVYQSLPEMPKFKQGGSEKTIDKLKEFALPTLMSFGPSLLLQGAGIGTWACIACLAGGGGANLHSNLRRSNYYYSSSIGITPRHA